MTLLTLTTTCPSCHKTVRARVHRSWWMRLLPRSRHYRCRECGTYYVRIFSPSG